MYKSHLLLHNLASGASCSVAPDVTVAPTMGDDDDDDDCVSTIFYYVETSAHQVTLWWLPFGSSCES